MIVCNTTPLSCLLKIGKTELLRALYGQITVPHEVAVELDQAGPLHAGWRRQLDFLQVAETRADDPVLRLLLNELDAGEAAAIALAQEHGSDLLIIDDMAGRRLARKLGLRITGTVGVVLAAADAGLADAPLELLEELRAKGGLWLSDHFLDQLRGLLG